jgi:hypothetical protein
MPSVPIAIPSVIEIVLNSIERAPRGADALLHLLGQLPVVPVAGRHLNPAVGDPDQRAPEVLVGETDRLEERPGRRAVRTVQDGATLMPRVEAHACLSVAPRRGHAQVSSYRMTWMFSMVISTAPYHGIDLR